MGVSKAVKELESEYDVVPMLVPVFVNSTCLDRNIGECFVCTGELVIYTEDYACQISFQAIPYRQVHSATEVHKHCCIFPFNNFHCSVQHLSGAEVTSALLILLFHCDLSELASLEICLLFLFCVFVGGRFISILYLLSSFYTGSC